MLACFSKHRTTVTRATHRTRAILQFVTGSREFLFIVWIPIVTHIQNLATAAKTAATVTTDSTRRKKPFKAKIHRWFPEEMTNTRRVERAGGQAGEQCSFCVFFLGKMRLSRFNSFWLDFKEPVWSMAYHASETSSHVLIVYCEQK